MRILSCDSSDSSESEEIDCETSKELNSRTTQSYQVVKSRFLLWKRRRLNNSNDEGDTYFTSSLFDSVVVTPKQKDTEDPTPQLGHNDDSTTGNWEVKELISTDGRAKLKTNVFFASFDQMSEEASGNSACTVIATVFAHWLHSNPQAMPTRHEFNSLIIQGSSEWQKLCSNETYLNFFPDKHFDMEMVLEANIRPLYVLPEKSFVGFFSPDKFEALKGAMSFDEIWKKISSNENDFEARIYIVSWNDHFFVLKMEVDAYYIIDSFGERLFRGCSKAYILKFDESSLMFEKKDGKIIGRGKECCGDFIKRFFAAITVRNLERRDKKEKVDVLSLYERLQIEFHYSSSAASSSSSSSFATCTSSSQERD